MNEPDDKLDVGRATAGEASEALALVWQGLEADVRRAKIANTLADALLKPEGLAGLFVARRNGRVVGAVWAEPLPGRIAVVTPPRVLDDEPLSTTGPLLRELLCEISTWQVSLAQIILDLNEPILFEQAREVGFSHGTDLLYMVSLEGVFPKAAPDSKLQLEPFAADQQSRLEKVIKRTYADSRDCAWLEGVRPMHEVVAGHRVAGVFRTEHWKFLRHGERDVGCLLLAEHPVQQYWELVYLGLVPEVRGRGWGLSAVRQAQWRLRQAGGKRLQLIVDVDNEPAIATYQSAGFVIWDRRSILMHLFSAQGL